MSFPQPANHPKHCAGCNGHGYQEAPPTTSQANGQPVTYTWVTTCTHVWWDDDPNPDLFTRTQLEKA